MDKLIRPATEMDPTIVPARVSMLSTQVWLAQSPEVRQKIALLFGMERSGTTEVIVGANGPQIISDGYTPSDLLVISTSNMQKMLDNPSEDFYLLFNLIVHYIDMLLRGEKPTLEQAVKVKRRRDEKLNDNKATKIN